MNVLGYVRVSTDEQGDSGAGLAAQRDAIERECAHRGWTLSCVVEDVGYSAKNLRRPGIQSALEQLRAGDVGGLVVAKLDRLSRSMLDFTAIMATAQKQGWSIVALDSPVDTTTPAGEAMVNVLATFAQFERRLIGQRTKEALAAKRAQGVRLGRPPALPAEVRDRIRADRAKPGSTLAAIAAQLNADGIPTAHGGRQWWPATVRAVLAAGEEAAAA